MADSQKGAAQKSAQSEIIDIAAKQLSKRPEDISLDAHWADNLSADSLDIVEIIMTVEERFDIQIPDEKAEKMKTVKDLVRYVEKAKSG